MKRAGCFLAIEILTVVAVIGIFRALESKEAAGLLAGGLFVSVGVSILLTGVRDASFRRTWTFPVGLAHLCVTSAPMWISRLLTTGTPLRDASVLGIPGTIFHRLSTGLYLALMASTVVDLLMADLRRRRTAS